MSTTPRPLGETYGKNGFHYEQVIRDGMVAVFKQRLAPGRGSLGYEVIVIRVKEESIAFDKLVPCREVAPANEEFGIYGWTYPTLDRAMDKFRLLVLKASAKTDETNSTAAK